MFPAMTRVLACLLLIAACADHSTPPSAPSQPGVRAVTPRAQLPKAVAPLVPQHGVYAAGGGLTSAPWRVVIDDDANTIYAGSSKQVNGSSLGKLDKEQTQPLSPHNKEYFAKLADEAWREPLVRNTDPIADYDELLIIGDGDDTFLLEGYGPIKRPKAAKLIEMMRAAGGL
jgi:hypothetical protein